MSGNDNTIEARLVEASQQLVASFSNLDTEAELRAVRSGLVPVGDAQAHARSPRWLAVAAVVTLLAGGTLVIAVSRAMRSESGNDSASPIVSAPETAPGVSPAPSVTDPAATTAPTTTDSSAPTTAPAQTELIAPAATPTTVPPTSAPDTTGPLVESPNDVFVTVSGDRRAVIDVRDAVDIVASFDLSCPPERDCAVQPARVMGDTIWVAIAETEPGSQDTVVRSRLVSVSRSTGDVVEHLSLDGPAAVRSAGRGADGVVYAHLGGQEPSQNQLVAVERGDVRVVATGVSGFRLSDDGRFLAVSFSNPPKGEPSRFEITNLVDRTTAGFQTDHVNAGPAAWSPDGRYLIVNEQWEDGTAWVIDPWSGSGEPIPGTESLLDGACFMSDRVIAHRTWNVGYGQGDAQPGVVRLTSLDTGSTLAEIGDSLFGDAFRCHPDGSISYLRRPVIEVERASGFTQLEPDYEAPVELVHIAPDGTTSGGASGDVRMV